MFRDYSLCIGRSANLRIIKALIISLIIMLKLGIVGSPTTKRSPP